MSNLFDLEFYLYLIRSFAYGLALSFLMYARHVKSKISGMRCDSLARFSLIQCTDVRDLLAYANLMNKYRTHGNFSNFKYTDKERLFDNVLGMH